MRNNINNEVTEHNIEKKRPFPHYTFWIIGIILLCGAWFGTIAADDSLVAVPDVAAPPIELEVVETTPTNQATTSSQAIMAQETVYLPMIMNPGGCRLNSQETAVANLVMNHPDQGRATMQCDETLAQVARAKAEDMAARSYFGHTDPDGIGPNHSARVAGYALPTWYNNNKDGNNIESIAAGYPTAEAVWNAWLNSPGHCTHILAESSFWADQTNYGIGYYYDANSPYQHYWVFISAPPE